MIIHSNLRNYTVDIKEDLNFIYEILHTQYAFFIVDSRLADLYSSYFCDVSHDRLYILDTTEENKTIESVLLICKRIAELPEKRNTVLISFGGGITQDVSGFVSSILYRGIKWIYIPTTLLAACDSCIGSKTSINLDGYKNLIGTFYPPNHIYICPRFFDTLSDNDYKSGLGEVCKLSIMSGLSGLYRITENIDKLLLHDTDTVNSFVESSLAYKKSYIELDEYDISDRIKLNYGHTFAHAIETITQYAIPHGTAVAIGMIMANYISYMRGYMATDNMRQIEQLLKKIISVNPDILHKPAAAYIKVMRKDKKQTSSTITLMLIIKYESKCDMSTVSDVSEEEINSAIKHFLEIY